MRLRDMTSKGRAVLKPLEADLTLVLEALVVNTAFILLDRITSLYHRRNWMMIGEYGISFCLQLFLSTGRLVDRMRYLGLSGLDGGLFCRSNSFLFFNLGDNFLCLLGSHGLWSSLETIRRFFGFCHGFTIILSDALVRSVRHLLVLLFRLKQTGGYSRNFLSFLD